MKMSKGKLARRSRLIGRFKHKRRLTVNDLIKDFKIGDSVIIDIKSNYHKGMPHPRYRGRRGVVIDHQGKACVVKVRDGGKYKTLIVSPVHLKAAA
ncbi:50S ribosomal protein L21e [Candidatus Micrarchaeota archaeon]|nr:50S ribosomal protein L21e [Candidatus Micrarchaeota archaeon]